MILVECPRQWTDCKIHRVASLTRLPRGLRMRRPYVGDPAPCRHSHVSVCLGSLRSGSSFDLQRTWNIPAIRDPVPTGRLAPSGRTISVTVIHYTFGTIVHQASVPRRRKPAFTAGFLFFRNAVMIAHPSLVKPHMNGGLRQMGRWCWEDHRILV